LVRHDHERRDGPMKTLTKKQLVDILAQVPDGTPVYIYVEIRIFRPNSLFITSDAVGQYLA